MSRVVTFKFKYIISKNCELKSPSPPNERQSAINNNVKSDDNKTEINISNIPLETNKYNKTFRSKIIINNYEKLESSSKKRKLSPRKI